MIRVFNHEIKEGERAYFTVPAGELAHKAVVQLPVIVVAGKKEGPVLWINGPRRRAERLLRRLGAVRGNRPGAAFGDPGGHADLQPHRL